MIESLTAREKQVIELICKGYSNQQIADELLISRTTVCSHVKHIMQKFDVSSFDNYEKNVKRLRMALVYLREHKELL